jgi:predicted secreted protein
MSGISAQGSILSVSTGTGTAKPITAVSAANPAVVTCTAHGLANGDMVVLSGIVGTMSRLNGTQRMVSAVSANSFTLLATDTTGLTYTSGGAATPRIYTQVFGFLSFDGLDGSASDIDTTDLNSVAKEFISGLLDNGKFKVELKRIQNDAGQLALQAARATSAVIGIKLVLPDGGAIGLEVFVKSYPISGAVDALMKFPVDMKITGQVFIL